MSACMKIALFRIAIVHVLCQVYISEGTKQENKCSQELGYKEQLKDGTCPEMTKWNQTIGCCVNLYEVIKQDDLVDQLQRDSPRYCDSSKDQIRPLWDQSCPPGKGLDMEIFCCVPCLKCAPGYELAEYCLDPCRPCPAHHYSNKPVHNEKCVQCIECKALHRYSKEVCSPTAPAVCGQCEEGYHEPSDTNQDETKPCVSNGFQEGMVTESQRKVEDQAVKESVQGTSQDPPPSKTLDLQVPMFVLLVILTCIVSAGFILWLRGQWMKSHGTPKNEVATEEELKPMNRDTDIKQLHLSKNPSVEETYN